MAGHSMRRYAGQKRTWQNQYLGPFIGHEMNRCITCYRCVRYYRDYAGGKDLDAFGSRARMFFGREEDGVLESEFAGNLVEVCPTGVFTDKPFSKVYTRKWDLQSAPSICPHCSVGCNTFPAERYGVLKRVHNRYHGAVNGYFLCDRGRYGSHFVNHDKRIRQAGVRADDDVFEAPGRDAVLACGSRNAWAQATWWASARHGHRWKPTTLSRSWSARRISARDSRTTRRILWSPHWTSTGPAASASPSLTDRRRCRRRTRCLARTSPTPRRAWPWRYVRPCAA